MKKKAGVSEKSVELIIFYVSRPIVRFIQDTLLLLPCLL